LSKKEAKYICINTKMEEKEDKFIEVIKKYNIDLEKLKKEQIKLAKSLVIKDSIDFELADRIAGIDNIFFKNRIISVVVVIKDNEVLEQEYFEDKVNFPYIPGFRAYRELPAMISAFSKLDEKPDVVLVRGHGISHPQGLGIASHFSLALNVPVVGVADNLVVGSVKGENILLNGKIVGKIIRTKEGANPLYISPGSLISVDSAVKLVKKFTIESHKIPEPLRLAKRYAKEVMRELYFRNQS
jgi:deoxyribonuclease V